MSTSQETAPMSRENADKFMFKNQKSELYLKRLLLINPQTRKHVLNPAWDPG